MKNFHWMLAAALGTASITVAAQTGQTIADGQRAFMSAGCYLCHGTVGQGTAAGPRLAPGPYPAEALLAFVRGSARSMPSYDAQILPDAQLHLIHAYLSAVEASPPPQQIPLLR